MLNKLKDLQLVTNGKPIAYLVARDSWKRFKESNAKKNTKFFL